MSCERQNFISHLLHWVGFKKDSCRATLKRLIIERLLLLDDVWLNWSEHLIRCRCEQKYEKGLSTRIKEDFVWFFSPSVVSIFVTVKACLRKFILLWILLDADFNLSPAKTKMLTSYFDVVETKQILPGNFKMYWITNDNGLQ